MSPIAGQKAGPIGMNFFVDTLGWPGGCFRLKKIQFFFQNIFFPRATPGPSASFLYNKTRQSYICSL